MKIFAHAGTLQTKPWLQVVARAAPLPVVMRILGPVGEDIFGDGTKETEFREQLDQIPRDREILVEINSPGGSVVDGLGIYRALSDRREKVTTRVIALAASIASTILQAGKRRIIPRGAVVMTHKPWTVVEGNAHDMKEGIDALDAYENAMAEVYAQASGKTVDDGKAIMNPTRYFKGEEAVAWGLGTETNDDPVDFMGWEPSEKMRAEMPHHIYAMITGSASKRPSTKTAETMNRTAILALLAQHGVTMADDATDEVLLAKLNELVAGRRVDPAQRDALTTSVEALVARFDSLVAENRSIREARTQEVTARHSRIVDTAIAEWRIEASDRDMWIREMAADESGTVTRIQAREPRYPGGPPAITIGEGAGSRDIAKGIATARGALLAWRRGNDVSAEQLRDGAYAVERIIAKHRKHLHEVLAVSTNTIDSDLQRNVILSDGLRAFKRRLVPMMAFSTTFSNVPLRTEGGTAKVAVPYHALQTTASTDFIAANGYDTFSNTNDGAKDITVDQRKYQMIDYSSETLGRQPFFDVQRHLMMAAEQLGVDTWTDVLEVVTLANYGAAAFTGLSSAFDVNDVIDLRTLANQADWPEVGRSLVLDSGYEGELLKDNVILAVDSSGSTDALRDGVIKRLGGFAILDSPRVPSNSENLVGFISMPSAILIATAPIEPAPGVRNLLVSYELVMDPDTGIGFSYRHGGNDILDRDYHVIEVAYGKAVGEVAALERLTSA